MFCYKCGNEVADDARFCTNCGHKLKSSAQGEDSSCEQSCAFDQAQGASPIAAEASAATVMQTPIQGQNALVEEAQPAGAQAQSQSNKNQKRNVIIASVVAGVILIAAAVVCIVMYMQQKAYEEAHAPQAVSFALTIPDYVVDGSTGVPLTIEGQDLDGNSVSEKVLVGETSYSIELLRGSYTVAQAGMPVGGNGMVYSYAEEPQTLVIDANGISVNGDAQTSETSSDQAVAGQNAADQAASEQGDSSSEGASVESSIGFGYTPIQPQDVTDEQIKEIAEWMAQFQLPSQEVEATTKLVEDVRKKEIERLAEEKRKKAEEEARKRAAALRKAAFGSFPKSFSFTSGVGAWGSGMDIAKDGTFTFTFHDANRGETDSGYDGGTVYLSEFKGKFTALKKISNNQFSLQLDYLTSTHKDETYIKDHVKYIFSSDDAYGLGAPTSSPRKGWTLYFPGTSVSVLNDQEQIWLQYKIENRSTLPCYVITNGEYAWFSD